jgi:hypothetical protein
MKRGRGVQSHTYEQSCAGLACLMHSDMLTGDQRQTLLLVVTTPTSELSCKPCPL